MRNDFGATDGHNIYVNFIWGLNGINKDEVSYFDPRYAGEPSFDEEFDLTS